PDIISRVFEMKVRDFVTYLKNEKPFGEVAAGLKTNWKYSPKRPVIYHQGHGVDGEFNFLRAKGVSEGQNSQSVKSINNDAPLIGTTPLSSVYPLNIVENVVDSDDPSYRGDEKTLVGLSLPPHPEASKTFKILGKRKVASGVLGKALPPKVQKVPARASKVAGEALWMLKVILLSLVCSGLLQNGPLCIESKRKRLKSFKIQLLQEIESLKQDRATVVSKVILDATMKLVRSDELDQAKGSFSIAGLRHCSVCLWNLWYAPDLRYSRIGVIQLSPSSLTKSATPFSVMDLFCMTSTKTSFASLEKVIDACLLRASSFLFCSCNNPSFTTRMTIANSTS
nr:hypothetical protein [Tanacetum cinerariifolium]